MNLNRELQLQILQRVASAYPASIKPQELGLDDETADIVRNIHYLTDHGLIDTSFSQAIGVRIPRPSTMKATHRGLDFLADDGGLSAVLGVVTIKFHEDALRDIIQFRLEESELPQQEKSRMMEAIRELPAESLKQLTTKLVDTGLQNLPRAVELIRGFFP